MGKRTRKKSSFITIPCNEASSSMMPDRIERFEVIPGSADSPEIMAEPMDAAEMMQDLKEPEALDLFDECKVSTLPEDLSTVAPEKLSDLTETQFKNLVNKFLSAVKNNILCESILQITVICQSQRFIECPVYQEYTAKALKNIQIYENPGVLMLSEGLFLAIMSYQELDDKRLEMIKKLLLSYFEKINVSYEYYTEDCDEITVHSLPDAARRLAEYILTSDSQPKLLSSGEKNTFFLWCVATLNILSNKNLESTIDIDYSWAVCKNMIKRIHSFRCLCEFESIDPSNVYDEVNCVVIVQGLSKLEICFDILLRVILADEALIEKAFDYAESMLLCDIKRLLVYFANELFVKKNKDDVVAVLKATAMSMLKALLSFSTFYPNGLEEHGVVLIEKLIQFIIQAYSSTFKGRFELQVMSLETCLLVLENNWIPMEQYCFLLQMETELKEEELLVVDALIKVLMHSLEFIKSLDVIQIHTSGTAENFLTERFPYENVQQFGDHMEHSFIVSYVSVLLALFCVENETYKTHIQNNFQRTVSNACIDELEKFQEFLVLVENLNPVGQSLIEKTISVFQTF